MLVRLTSLQFVKPYVKSNKNDANDAKAICETVTRLSMRFVAIIKNRITDIRYIVSTGANSSYADVLRSCVVHGA